MKIRHAVLVGAVAAGLFAAPSAVEAQPSEGSPRIGILLSTSRKDNTAGSSGFVAGLREHGYVDGQNIAVEWRGAEGQRSRFPGFVAELLQLKVDVIVAAVNPAIEAARKASKTIPIVMVVASDPVGLGFVDSLARPGGNVTGLTWQTPDVVQKRLQLLKETIPTLDRVAVLWDVTEPARRRQVAEAEAAAPKVGVQLQILGVRGPGELEGAFAAMTREGAGAVLMEASSMLTEYRARVADLAIERRLPTMGWYGRMTEDAGILMSYSPSVREQYRRAAYFVDRILRGAEPASLPVERPTKFELAINTKTAKAIGLTLPPSVLLRADRLVK